MFEPPCHPPGLAPPPEPPPPADAGVVLPALERAHSVPVGGATLPGLGHDPLPMAQAPIPGVTITTGDQWLPINRTLGGRPPQAPTKKRSRGP